MSRAGHVLFWSSRRKRCSTRLERRQSRAVTRKVAHRRTACPRRGGGLALVSSTFRSARRWVARRFVQPFRLRGRLRPCVEPSMIWRSRRLSRSFGLLYGFFLPWEPASGRAKFLQMLEIYHCESRTNCRQERCGSCLPLPCHGGRGCARGLPAPYGGSAAAGRPRREAHRRGVRGGGEEHGTPTL